VDVVVVDNADEVAREAARRIQDFVHRQPTASIGLATGGTQLGIYRQLVDAYRQGTVSFAGHTFFMLDEYAGVHPSSSNSFQHVVRTEFLDQVDATPHSLHILDGTASDLAQEADRFEQVLHDTGGIDLQLLGIGTNSHIGFNEPGSALDSRTRVVQLQDDTIRSNSPYFSSPAEVPRTAISQGLGTIMEARSILLMATGALKSPAVHAMVDGDVSPEYPASILQRHQDVTVILDTAAASLLSARV
jgi:glucosamine-6-phosphate deaminase